MAGTQLDPEKITSPFQLMAAWFAMLVLLVTVLLTAANNITRPSWAAGYLVVFASILVLVVITCVILMLTKFRPNLQEGKEYAEWLKDQNSYSSGYLVKESMESPSPRVQLIAKPSTNKPEQPNKNFLISIVNAAGSQSLNESLKNLGFNSEIYETNRRSTKAGIKSLTEQEGIWVGSRVDPKAAIQAIKLALPHWPELKYLHLSTDGGSPPDYVHDQLFLGGSSSTARRYGLKPWSLEELSSLDEGLTSKAFHSAIRAKYS